MKCHLGLEGLNIDMHGEIISSWCGAKVLKHSTNKGIRITNQHYNCPFEYCNNSNDTHNQRYKISFISFFIIYYKYLYNRQ